ncbi:DNA-3-methyladenine glycosylase [Neolewinella antarctica]|uniref:Putative 3-methyladenine DNA glycosylase n=1 Tax=Neolewinella antarctica TaxID=442734 RepID=A0ABX0XCI3_9BACT|nr:DNA-3-methyladenine glycosylase [Neolewinella antarctica]NJC26553.1 DNA-3-methyladenine glycosylase [Neolewinella antarctica]
MPLSAPNPVTAAKLLLGAELMTTTNGETTSVMITEVEAYFAPDDLASHAAGYKKTKRTEVFYHPPGTAYVYLCYGIHEMFNVVTGPEGTPHAVLIRAGEPVRGLDVIRRRRKLTGMTPRLSSGPGVLTKALGIDRRFNGVNLFDPAGEIRLILPDEPVAQEDIVATPRIGIDYAGEPWVSKPWRLFLRGNSFVSRLNAFKES